MRVLHYTHPACLRHQAGAMHPERPDRLRAVAAGVRAAEGVEVVERRPPMIDPEKLSPVHARAYVDAVQRFCLAGGGQLDADTGAVPASWEAALRAAGAGPAAVRALLDGEGDAAFLTIRPPGHHAGERAARGFCLFNNIAVTAAALAAAGSRSVIIDWDVHHGDGTQNTFIASPDVCYVSLHEFPAYPGSGWMDETGYGKGAGTTLNFPLPTGTGGDVYRAAFDEVIEPVVATFGPDWVLVSCGFDAHRRDPLAGIGLMEEDYAFMGAAVTRMAPPGRLVFFLEGGYDLTALEGSARAVVESVAGGEGPTPPDREPSGPTAWRVFRAAREVFGEVWELG